MSTDNRTMVAVDGSDALAYLIVRPGSNDSRVTVDAAAVGLAKRDAAHILRQVADLWEAEGTEETSK